MSDAPYDQGPDHDDTESGEPDDQDRRGGKHSAGEHPDEPDVDPQPQPLPDKPA